MLLAVLSTKVVLVGGDLNVHVRKAAEPYERVHEDTRSMVHGHGRHGLRNTEGENILRTCIASDLAVLNTYVLPKEFSAPYYV